ncbi:MAG TPA: hypothetical protein DIT01_17205 [Lentisphaeria bacterium]|nr:hypothetical protein [Lentisphaeria bacterium]
MKIGILGDIHANLEAFHAILGALETEECGKILCTGDIVGYGPNPQECVDLVRELKMPCVMGNHDEWTVVQQVRWEISDLVKEDIIWTRATLSEDAMAWLTELPRFHAYGGVEVIHASNAPSMIWPYVRDEKSLVMNFKYQKCSICFNGHTHVPAIGCKSLDTDPLFLDLSEQMQLATGCKLLINPGSVGQPRDKDPRAACAIYETRDRSLRFVRVPYDIARTQEAMAAVDRPQHFIDRLALGQ